MRDMLTSYLNHPLTFTSDNKRPLHSLYCPSHLKLSETYPLLYDQCCHLCPASPLCMANLRSCVLCNSLALSPNRGIQANSEINYPGFLPTRRPSEVSQSLPP